MDIFVKALKERAKELNCLYSIEDTLSKYDWELDKVFDEIIKFIPPGWQYPEFCQARIIFDNKTYNASDFFETKWVLSADIALKDIVGGKIEIYYTEEMPIADEGPFLKEERKLIDTIADRIGHNVLHRRLKKLSLEWHDNEDKLHGHANTELKLLLEMLRRTDQHLFSIISRKMINYLYCHGVEESKPLFEKLGSTTATLTEINSPSKKQVLETSYNMGYEAFNIAKQYQSDDAILLQIQKWIHEEKSHFLVKALANLNTPLTEIADAIRRYYHINPELEEKVSPISKGIRVSLIRRFLTDQLQFLNIAKGYSRISDFYHLLQKLIFSSESHGKLGGKSAGLFLADKILRKSEDFNEGVEEIKIPKTWYISSDGVISFIYYNNLEDVIEQKYKEIDDVRQEYPHVIQAFKNSHFPPDITNGLSRALDDFSEKPIIVRSSSLLEDRMGSAFAGKYKSLFLANQGTKEERMEALMDAISEVYASTFGPDPIGYRIERGLLDFNEEMGIMIQEVVGRQVGKYFLPAFAGVAFSNNEFRWSPRIKRDDGLIRMVAGLGTRAVDRIGDDYPTLLAPGQPDLRINLSNEDILKYSQKNIDVLNLETNTFESISLQTLINEVEGKIPMLNEIFSIYEHHHIRKPVGLGINPKKDNIVVTFENLISNTQYIDKINLMLKVLSKGLKMPVDIEFACDGNNLYILQCRPQSSLVEGVSAEIPKDIDEKDIIFTANKNISNGKLPDMNYIVYIDPEQYSLQSSLDDLKSVGKVVGLLNKMLPKKSFVLMGPGRWGSRDDIRLGVRVTYADINNTAMLIEIARQKGNYIPELSFGTHFFQDLVEASIRYLPLYPDDETVIFNEKFLNSNENILNRFLPEFAYLEDIVKIINVRESSDGKILRLLMNAENDEAVGYLADPAVIARYKSVKTDYTIDVNDEPLRWRLRMADAIAAELNPDEFGVIGLYLYGTVFNETAGPNSDIDLLVHFAGTSEQKEELLKWFRGWNLCLSHINYNKSGFKLSRFLDINIISETELAEKAYFAELIDPKFNSSKKLILKK